MHISFYMKIQLSFHSFRSYNNHLKGLNQNSIQGDSKVRDIFKQAGVSSTFQNNTLTLVKKNIHKFNTLIDLTNSPDIYQPLKCTLFALNETITLTGISTLKNKETDRIKATEKELKKLSTDKIIETYKDHRMAMSFAPLSLKYGKITIKNSQVVSKSYPNFWDDLSKAGFIIEA